MTELDYLEADLETHLASRELLLNGGGYFFKREGYSVAPLLASYDKIIKSIQDEITTIKGKSRKRKTKKN
jgi:hypothetical protein